jgi:hypothetical protein
MDPCDSQVTAIAEFLLSSLILNTAHAQELWRPYSLLGTQHHLRTYEQISYGLAHFLFQIGRYRSWDLNTIHLDVSCISLQCMIL